MKIGQYEQMMSYLTRPGFDQGGSPLVPEPKPTDPTKKLDLYLQGYLGTGNKQFYIDKLQETIDQYQESGIMEQKDAVEYLQKKKQEYLDLSKQGKPLPSRDNKALGGPPLEPQQNVNMSTANLVEESTTGPGGFPMTAGVSVLPEAYNTVKKATDFIQSADITPAKAKKVVLDFFKQRQPYAGANQQKDFTPEKNFLSVLKGYMDKFSPTLSGASRDLGINRNLIRGIQDRINLQETGQRSSNLGFDVYSQKAKIPEPEGGLQFKDVTTLMKKDPDQFINLKKKKDEFLDPESMGHYLGIKFARDDKGIRTGIGKFQYDQLSTQLRNLNVKKNKQGEYSVNDAINKLLDKNKSKIVKGQRKSDIGLGRQALEKKFDPELFSARNNVKYRTTTRSQGLDTYLPNAVDDAGHPYSLTKSEQKFKKLFKDSNINKLNTLVYQDSLINSQLFKNSGYERKYEKMFETLSELQNKKVTPEIQKQILKVKKDMNDNYNYIQDIISDVSKLDKYINRDKLNADKKFLKYLSETQADRVQKIDVNVPKVGEKFKSEDIFVDMSVVNPKYIMGYVNNINSKAKKFKDLSLSEQELYKNNLLQQNAEIVSEYYKKAKFPEEDIEAVRETVGMDFAQGGRAGFKEGTPKEPIFKKGAASQLSKLSLVNPAAVVGLNYLFGVNPESGTDRAVLATEAALAKELVRGSQDIVRKMPIEKRRAVQKLLNLGMSPKFAIKAARALTPLGLLSLAGEGAYQGGKYMLERRKMLESLTDEQRSELLRKEKQEAIGQMRRGSSEAFEGIMAASGGLIRKGFANGPEDPSKRKFIKIMGGLASIPVVGKFFKIAERAAPLVEKIKTPSLPGKPEWFDSLVNRVIAEGEDVTKRFATKDRQIVHTKKIDDETTVTVTQDLDDDMIMVDIDDPVRNIMGEQGDSTVMLRFKKGQADETTKGTPPDEFDATEADMRNYMDGPDDYTTEFVDNTVSDVKNLTSDLTKVKSYATGKNPTMKEIVESKRRREAVKYAEERPSEYAAERGPQADYGDEDIELYTGRYDFD